jgi:precorrin-6x reductase
LEPDRDVILQDATLIREEMRRIVHYASDATEKLDERIENQTLDGRTEAEELREMLERVQALILEVSEGLDAYQQRHAR